MTLQLYTYVYKNGWIIILHLLLVCLMCCPQSSLKLPLLASSKRGKITPQILFNELIKV